VVIILKKLYSLLNAEERRKAAVVCLLLMIVSVVEVAGVASILPLIGVIANPEIIDSNHYLSYIYNAFSFTSHQSFIIFLGICFLGILIAGLAIQAVGVWVLLRFSFMRSYTWSLRLFTDYLRQPYEWFISRHSAQLTTSVLGEVRQVVSGVLIPTLHIIASVFTSLMLFVLLIITDPLLAMAAGISLGSLYFVISFFLAKRVRNYGQEQHTAQRQRQRVVQETFGGIKDIKIAGIEDVRANTFSGPAYVWAHTQIKVGMAVQLPHLLTQAFLFGGMLLILLYLVLFYGGLQEALPVIALFAFATYRLMPNIQKIYANISTINQHKAVFDSISEDIKRKDSKNQSNEKMDYSRESLGLKDTLELDNLTYSYPSETKCAVKNISINIPAKSMIGFVGSSGSGKTTLVDLILGLLRPSSGTLNVDGHVINDARLRAWQRTIGYVPQQIFLTDDTVSANIAFGVPKRKLSQQRVEEAAKAANIHDFIVSQLPQGYETTVGDKGVRLSGGQRQRLGIARALYHDPDVLIFDEATSALDNLTEQAVMEAVNKLGSIKTIIIIAHRLSTVQKCDCIYVLNAGEIEDKGTYDELLISSSHFQTLTTDKSENQDLNSI